MILNRFDEVTGSTNATGPDFLMILPSKGYFDDLGADNIRESELKIAALLMVLIQINLFGVQLIKDNHAYGSEYIYEGYGTDEPCTLKILKHNKHGQTIHDFRIILADSTAECCKAFISSCSS